MSSLKKTINLNSDNLREYCLFSLVAILLFLVKMYDRFTGAFQWYESIFILNGVWAALLINYWFIPLYFYKKRIKQFILFSFAVIAISFLIDEFLFEKIFHPHTKGLEFNLISIFDTITNISIFVGYKLAWDAFTKHKKILTLKALLTESQLEQLKTQINPHFLFNNLNNLYSYSLDDPHRTPEIILKLSSVLRYMLYECNENKVPLAGEIESLKNYIDLCNIQLEERGVITFDYNNFDSETMVLPLVFLVYVENAFKHASSSLAKNIQISVCIGLEGDFITFSCKNNFLNKNNKQQLGGGIGLKNVEERLKVAYGNKYQLHIDKEEDIFIVSLKLPQ